MIGMRTLRVQRRLRRQAFARKQGCRSRRHREPKPHGLSSLRLGETGLIARTRRRRRKPGFSRMRIELIVTRRRHIARDEPAERANIGGNLPNLVFGNLAAERRHPVRPALAYASGDVFDRAAVNPDIVHQRGTRASAAVGMTAATIVPGEQLLALAHMEGDFLIFAAGAALVFDWPSGPRRVASQRDLLTVLIQHGVTTKRSILALASCKQQQRDRHRERPCHCGEPMTVCIASARGTRKLERIASTSCRLRANTASISCLNDSSSRRTPIAIANIIGKGPSIEGWTGVTRSGGVCRPAKYPPSGPHTMPTSMSPAATASIKRAGGFFSL